MSICSNFALNVSLPIYLLLIIYFIAMFIYLEFRKFRFVYVGEGP